MRKTLFFICCAVVLTACSSTPQKLGVNAVPEKLTSAITSADRTCVTDADCVAVHKGCCECAGYEAVNAKSAAKIQKIWDKSCQLAPCTREMCYVQITPQCQQGVCIGTPKPMDSYFGR